MDKLKWLLDHGYFVGLRDLKLNTKFQGKYMITENEYKEYELPTEDGSNGPWCIVGDDITDLINQAYYSLT